MIRSTCSSSTSTPRLRRGTAHIELLLLVVALLSFSLLAIALWKICRAEVGLRMRAHHDAFQLATDAGWGREERTEHDPRFQLPVARWRGPASPADLNLGALPDSTVTSYERGILRERAGAFGVVGPGTIERRASLAREAWTWKGGALGYTQDASATRRVHAWFSAGLDASLGRVRGGLRLAD